MMVDYLVTVYKCLGTASYLASGRYANKIHEPRLTSELIFSDFPNIVIPILPEDSGYKPGMTLSQPERLSHYQTFPAPGV